MNYRHESGRACRVATALLTLVLQASANWVDNGDFSKLVKPLPHGNWATTGKASFPLLRDAGTGAACVGVTAAAGALAPGETASLVAGLNARPSGARFLLAVEARGEGRLRLGGLEYEGSADKPVFMGSDRSHLMDLTPTWRWHVFEYEIGNPDRLVKAAVEIAFSPVEGAALNGNVRQVVVHSPDDAGAIPVPEDAPTELTVPLLAAPATLKGDLSDPVWSQAMRFSGFVANRDLKRRLSPRENTVLAFYTEEALYLGLISRTPAGKGLTAHAYARDASGPIYYDDNFEIGIVTPATNMMYQFIANAMGSIYDGTFDKTAFHGGWNSQVQAAASTNDGFFTLEMRIPAADMAGARLQAGDAWRLAVVRNYRDREVFYEDHLTPLLNGGFREWDRFARLILSPDATASDVRLSGCASGLADVGLGVRGTDGAAVFTRSLTDVSQVEEIRRKVPVRTPRNVILLPKAEFVTPAGTLAVLNTALRHQADNQYRLDLSLARQSDGRPLARVVRDFSVEAPLALRSEIDCVQQTVALDISAEGLPPGDGTPLPALIEIERDRDPKVRVSQALTLQPGTTSRVTVPIGTLGDGLHRVDCTVRDTNGVLLAEAMETWSLFKTAYWATNGLGEEDVVPPPYTAPSYDASRRALANWGHRIELGDGGLPAQIHVEGVPLLAAPVALTGRIDGQPYRLAGSPTRVNAGRRNGIELEGDARLGPVRSRVKLTFEYDGMLRVDAELAGEKPFRIDDLSLRIPMRPEAADVLLNKFATLRNESPMGGMTFLKDTETAKAGDYTSVGVREKSGPNQWDRNQFWGQLTVMNMARGLSWFTETDEHWSVAPSNAYYTVEQSATQTVLVVQMVSAPKTCTRWPFTFGLQATPVRPRNPSLKREQWAMRVQHAAAIPRAEDFATLVAPGKNGFFATNPSPGLKPLSHPHQQKLLVMNPWIVVHHPPDEAAQRAIYRRTVDFWTKPGRRLAIYNNPSYVYRQSPEYQYFKALWGLERPGSFWEWDMIEVNRACQSFQDFWIYHHDAMLSRFPENYIQLDCPTIQEDTRAINGMGYTKDGKRHPTLNIFETRRMYKRAYALATRRVPNVYYSLHQSADWAAATIGFCNATAEGEEWRQWIRHQFEAPGRHLDYFRYSLASHVGPERYFMPQIGYGAAVRGKTVHATGIYLLHDIPFERSNGDFRTNDEILAVMERIGLGLRDDLEFHPYWKPASAVQSSEPKLKTSYWTRPGGAFIVVVNVDWDKATAGTVKIDCGQLGLKQPKVSVYEPMENRFTPVAAAARPSVDLTIPAALFNVILIEELPK